MPTCPYCLEQIKPGAIACPHCARSLPLSTLQRQARRRRWLLIAGAGVLVAVILFVGSAAIAGLIESHGIRVRCENDARIFHRYSAEECLELVRERGKTLGFSEVESY